MTVHRISPADQRKKVEKANEKPFDDACAEMSINFREIRRAPSACICGWWVVVFLILSCVCVWQIVYQSWDYFAYATKTPEKYHWRASLPLPKLSICTEDWMDEEKLRGSLSPSDYAHLRYLVTSPLQLALLESPIDVRLSAKEATKESKAWRRIHQHVMDYGSNCSSTFLTCVVGGQHQNCCEGAQRFLHNGRMCFLIDLHANQTLAGSDGGVEIYALQRLRDMSHPSGCGTNDAVLSHQCDWHLSLVPSDSPLPYSLDNNVISSSAQIFLQVTRRQVDLLPAPFGDCVRREDRSLRYFPSYDPFLCQLEAEADAILKSCKCIPYGKLASGETSHGRAACNAAQLLSCEAIYQPHNATETPCPQLCRNTLLTVTANEASGQVNHEKMQADMRLRKALEKFQKEREAAWEEMGEMAPDVSDDAFYEDAGEALGALLAGNATDYDYGDYDWEGPEDVNLRQWTRIVIHYGQLVEAVIVEAPSMTVADLASKIGGAFSLWLGFKLMSFCQFFYFLHWHVKKRFAG